MRGPFHAYFEMRVKSTNLSCSLHLVGHHVIVAMLTEDVTLSRCHDDMLHGNLYPRYHPLS